MSRQANQSDNYQFNVFQKQLTNPVNGQPLDFYGNFRDDNNECLGITSEQYGIIQNTELMDSARQALELRDMRDYTEKVTVTGNGARFYSRFEFRNKQLANNVGDIFGYVLTLKNSFDRTLRAAIELGFLRLVCSNGMATMEKEFSVTRKHSYKISVDFLGEAIDNAIANGPTALKAYDDMARIELGDLQGLNVLDNLVSEKVLSGSLAANIKPLWLSPRRNEDKARNLYNLYNAVTEHASHVVRTDRFEYAEKVSGNVLLQFVNATRKPEKLARLVQPVKIPLPIIDVETV